MNNDNLCESALGVNAPAHWPRICDALSMGADQKAIHAIFSERLTAEMGARKWSQNKLAKEIRDKGFPMENQGNISRLLKKQNPTIHTLYMLAKALDIEPWTLLVDGYPVKPKEAPQQNAAAMRGKYTALKDQPRKKPKTVRYRTKSTMKRPR